MAARENTMTIVTGQQRIGKSNETLRLLFDEVIPSGRKGLILDINNEYEKYKIHYANGTTKEVKIERINHKDIINFSAQHKIECVRVIPYYDHDSTRMSEEDIDKFWVAAVNNFYGGAEVIEDLNKVFGDVLPKRFSSTLTNKAHRDVDMFLHMQSIGRVLPKIRQNANYYRFHKQLDSVDDSDNKLTGAFLTAFRLSEIIINRQYKAGKALFKKDSNDLVGNRMMRKFLYVDGDQSKLIGGFSEKMFYEACTELMRKNPSMYRYLMQEVDIGGRKIYTQSEAMKKRALEVFREFWGN